MDYTKVNSNLVYAFRDDVKKFFDPDEDSLEHEFFDRLLERPFMKRDVDNVPMMVRTIFNNAFYIATLIKMERLPQMYLTEYGRIAAGGLTRVTLWCNHVMPATMALVYSLLRRDAYNRSEILNTMYKNFLSWAAAGISEGQADFYRLLIDTPQAANRSPQKQLFLPDFAPLDICTLLEKYEVEANTLARDIDYVIERLMLSPDKEKRKRALLCAKDIIEEEIVVRMNADYYDNDGNSGLWKAHDRLKTLFKQEGLKWVSRIPDDDEEGEETEEAEEKTENETLKSDNTTLRAENETLKSDNAALKTENEDLKSDNATLRAENEQLKSESEQLRQAIEEAGQSSSSDRWEREWEDLIVNLLKPAFYNIEANARDFLEQIRGLDSIGVTAVARQFVKDNKIIPRYKKGFIWNILYAAKLYDRVVQNWGQQMDIKE